MTCSVGGNKGYYNATEEAMPLKAPIWHPTMRHVRKVAKTALLMAPWWHQNIAHSAFRHADLLYLKRKRPPLGRPEI